MTTEIWLGIITALIAAIAYFLKRIIDNVDKTTADVSNIKINIAEIKPKVELLWEHRFAPSHSPRQLNELGTKILNESGIKKIVDDKKETLLKVVKTKNVDNPYDAENSIEEVMKDLPNHCPDVIPELKQGAFNSGVDINTVLFVGAMYLRNKIFPELGFKIDEIEKFQPSEDRK
jgi:hypothetical protein